VSPRDSRSCRTAHCPVGGRVAGSNIGSSDMIKRMLEFVKEHEIKPRILKCAMKNINVALLS
jgi:D-arabinose 1-dehydrogenase-like Zn-dependent alcohol dehydrogenase